MTTAKLAASALMLALSMSCSDSDATSSRADSATEVVVEALDALPDEKATDWTSYAQQVSVVDVVSEVEQGVAADVALRGEYTTMRTLTVRIVGNAYEFAGGATPLRPGSVFTAQTDGWAYNKGEARLPVRAADSVRLEPGRRYVMAIGRQGTTWFPLTAATVVPVETGVVTPGPGQDNPVVAQLAGTTTDQLEGFFAAHPAEPLARKFADRDAIPRYQAVVAELARR
jgi:hypothetical protein